MTADLGLAGRHLLITGAGGLGRVLARASVDAGMLVTLVDRDPDALAAVQASDELVLLQADLSDVSSHGGLVDRVARGLGPITAFVPTAAVIRRQHDMATITEQDWDVQASVNQKAVFFLTRAVAEQMKPVGGAIVLVSSAAGVTGGVAGTTIYGSTKAGVLAMGRGFARAYAQWGIRVNTVVPGSMDTPMLWVGQKPEAAAVVADLSALGRVGEPLEIARPILFLLCDWASYVTGSSLGIDGGWLYR